MSYLTDVNQNIARCGGDWLSLFETRPLEDILAEIAEGWSNTQRAIGRVRAGVTTEVSYVL